MQELATRARQLIAMGQLQAARDHWQAALNLLPPTSKEHQAIRGEIAKLDARLNPQPKTDWRKRLGPLGAVVAFLIKFKTALLLLLSKGSFLFNLLGFLLFYWALYGWVFGCGLFVSILIHELGHYIVIRQYGFAAALPRFHLFGAFVRWRGANVDPGVAAIISLAGPFFGFLSGLLAYGLFLQTHNGVWLALAQFAAWLNLLNLIPVWIFDGASAMNAIGKQERVAILIVSLILAYVLHSYLLLFVALATGYRLMRRDFPAEPRQKIAYYFVALMIGTGFLSWYCINQQHSMFPRHGQRESVQNISASDRRI
ncbi:MAG: hypothetical protein JO061_13880 [Acidobacteriaceae bacterium]|nr:hypothetical protein [Acidobacteriaceae bacterium]